MKWDWDTPKESVAGDAVEYRVKVTLEMHEIRAHPDQFKMDVGDTYQGIRIVRDAAIPLGEIHVIEGDRRMVLKAKR